MGVVLVDKILWLPFYYFVCPMAVWKLSVNMAFWSLLLLQIVLGTILFYALYSKLPKAADKISKLAEALINSWHWLQGVMPILRDHDLVPHRAKRWALVCFKAWQFSPPMYLLYKERWGKSRLTERLADILLASVISTVIWFLLSAGLLKALYHMFR